MPRHASSGLSRCRGCSRIKPCAHSQRLIGSAVDTGLGSDRPDEVGAARRASRLEARDALGQLAGLPARKRAVLTLQVSGHRFDEIADLLGMTQRTVERQLLRPRAAVRKACEDALAA